MSDDPLSKVLIALGLNEADISPTTLVAARQAIEEAQPDEMRPAVLARMVNRSPWSTGSAEPEPDHRRTAIEDERDPERLANYVSKRYW